jgi:rare lipoprotein A (peptidoglycan hydrolase)
MRRTGLWIVLAGALLIAPDGRAEQLCDSIPQEEIPPPAELACPNIDPVFIPSPLLPSPFELRIARYKEIAAKHKVCGLASYYSRSLEGTLTANGERYRGKRFTAAHLTLPLGCWIEVTARATGKTIRCRVNDRGPYVRKFVLDLSVSAARALGVDVTEDRHVDFRIIALKGEEPLPEEVTAPVELAAANR